MSDEMFLHQIIGDHERKIERLEEQLKEAQDSRTLLREASKEQAQMIEQLRQQLKDMTQEARGWHDSAWAEGMRHGETRQKLAQEATQNAAMRALLEDWLEVLGPITYVWHEKHRRNQCRFCDVPDIVDGQVPDHKENCPIAKTRAFLAEHPQREMK